MNEEESEAGNNGGQGGTSVSASMVSILRPANQGLTTLGGGAAESELSHQVQVIE